MFNVTAALDLVSWLCKACIVICLRYAAGYCKIVFVIISF